MIPSKLQTKLTENFFSKLTKAIKDDIEDTLNKVDDISKGIARIHISQASEMLTNVGMY